MTVVILAAGRATRLGGRCKLLVEAAGLPVVEWHRAAIGPRRALAVVRPEHAEPVRDHAPWLAVLPHGIIDGPAGALAAYLRSERDDGEPVTVLFGDTLLGSVPAIPGDWAGVAPSPQRVWDYADASGRWVRGTPRIDVCCGVYQFTDRAGLASVIARLLDAADGREVPMAAVLDRYHDTVRPIRALPVHGWQDAGDETALAAVERMES